MEQWLPVDGYEGFYEVSCAGRVRSLDRMVIRRGKGPFVKAGRILAQSYSEGYPYVKLCVAGDQLRRSVSVIVCTAFHGHRPSKMEVAHGDGDPANCEKDNLRWATREANAADKFKHGTQPLGSKHRMAKLDAEKVHLIRIMFAANASDAAIAATMGVSRAAIYAIRKGYTWSHAL